MLELAREWASLPDPATGESVYGNGNKALHSVAEVKQALNSARGGAALVSDDPNLNLASAQKPGQGGTSPDGTAADDGTGTVADGTGVAMGDPGPEKIRIERIAVKYQLPLYAIAIKMGLEEAITALKKEGLPIKHHREHTLARGQVSTHLSSSNLKTTSSHSRSLT
jgi:hypothetical protein